MTPHVVGPRSMIGGAPILALERSSARLPVQRAWCKPITPRRPTASIAMQEMNGREIAPRRCQARSNSPGGGRLIDLYRDLLTRVVGEGGV